MSLFSFRRPALDPAIARRLKAIRQRSRGLAHAERPTRAIPVQTMAQLVEGRS